MTPGRRHHWLATAAALACAAAGCSSHNPGYFPYYFPGGRIQQEHAKPGGWGYFKNFDPKACKLEVSPPATTAPPGSAVVLVATVYDKDGQPRRDRRVEWLVEGPGNIIEVDESGLYAGRGYKVDNKYAVCYTNYTSHCITRGNDDPRDDVNIAPGQTFCVLHSAVPGETTVTALAPGVFNWDAGRVVVKVCWADSRFKFPTDAVARSGTETTLLTTISPAKGGESTAGYRVRYRVLDGPAAVLLSRGGGTTSTSQTGATPKETETLADGNGEAVVRLVQTTALAGKTRVAVEVVKPSENGVGPGTVVSRRETTVEWAAPQVELNVTAPKAAGVNGVVPVTVSLSNLGAVDGVAAKVRVAVPDGATVVKADPPPASQEPGALTWAFDALPAGSRQEVTLQVRPTQTGNLTLAAAAQTSDGMRAEKQATTRVEVAKLAAHFEAPPAVLVGAAVPLRLIVTNPGAGPAENATAWVRFDDGLASASDKNPVEVAVGTLAPGATKTVDVPLTGKAAGRFGVRASVTADGSLSAAAEPLTVEVRRAELALSVSAPARAYLGQDVTWNVVLRNPGDSPVSNVVVRGTLPPEVRGKDASDGGTLAGGVAEWRFPELKPGESKAVKVTASAAQLADRANLSVTATGDAGAAGSGARPTGDPVKATGAAAVALIGTPALVLELATPAGPIEVGKRASVTVRVRNTGTVSARGVQVTAFGPPELKPTGGSGTATGRVEDGQVVFAAVDDVRPGETATFTVQLDATAAGPARVRAEVRALHLANPLKEEQALTVVGSR